MHHCGCYVLLCIIVSEVMHSATSYRPCIWPVISISRLPRLLLSAATAAKDLLLYLLIPVSRAMIIILVFFLLNMSFAGHYAAQILLFIRPLCMIQSVNQSVNFYRAEAQCF